jgi:geranylgeranylglycerol-phosphate geranylgeranyltransferase
MAKSSGFLRLMRPLNCVMMGFAVIVGASIAAPTALGSSWVGIMFGFVTGFTLTATSMAINDYYDRYIDAVNEPNRPIPSGQVKPKEALVFAFFLTAIGLVSAYLTNLTSISCFVIAVIAWCVFAAYTTIGKRTGLPGNFLVSVCVGIPFVYGNYIVANAIALNVLIFVSMVFLSNTGREITKGIVDVKGDKERNVRTLAILFGEKTAAFSAAVFYVLAVTLTPAPWLLGIVSVWFIPLVVVTDLGLVASSYVLIRDHSRESARRVKRIVMVCFLIGLLAFMAGAFG